MKSLKRIYLFYVLLTIAFTFSNALNTSSKKTEESRSTLQSNTKATGTKTNMLRQPDGNTNTNTNTNTNNNPVNPNPNPNPSPNPNPNPSPNPNPNPSPNPNPNPSPNPNPNADGKTDGNGIASSLRTASYADLVVTVQRPMCPDSEDPRLGKKKLEDLPSEDYYPAQGPKRKPNPYRIMDSEEFMHINYLFDYLDEFLIKSQGKTFLQILVAEFKKVYEEAKAMPKTDSDIADPYTPEKLLFYFSNGAAGTEPFTDPRIKSPKSQDVKVITPANPTDEGTIFKTISAFNKNFNPEIYKKGITPMQILKILIEWQWAPTGDKDIMDAKKIVDKYDFDGDGSLNPMEFIVFTIRFNMKQVHQCKKNCYKDIVDKIIDPLFMYLDCDNDGYINSENMWAGLRNINRQTKSYDMYQCQFPVELNKAYRTNSVNDFVLKHSRVADGFLNNPEFRKGLLLGYWERQVSETDITEGSDRTNKSARWENLGAKDTECEKIKGFFPKNSGQFNAGLAQATKRRR